MTPTHSAAPATERGAILDALNTLNLCMHNYYKEPSAYDLWVEYQKAKERFAALVEQAAKEEGE